MIAESIKFASEFFNSKAGCDKFYTAGCILELSKLQAWFNQEKFARMIIKYYHMSAYYKPYGQPTREIFI